MSEIIKELKKATNETLTDNGDIAYESTLNANLDFFNSAAIATQKCYNTSLKFVEALEEDRETAIANMLRARDIRNGGAGRREIFRKCLKIVAKDTTNIHNTINLLYLVPEIGRWDDLLVLLDDDMPKLIQHITATLLASELVADYAMLGIADAKKNLIVKNKQELFNNLGIKKEATKDISLVSKWLPNINSRNPELKKKAKMIAKSVNLSDKDYRTMRSAVNKHLDLPEIHLSNKEIEKINVEALPAKALQTYKRILKKTESYKNYMEKLKTNKTKPKVQTLYPHEILKDITNDYDPILTEKQWEAIDRSDIAENTIIVRDGSGSMHYLNKGLPINVANALTILFAESLKGELKNSFLTFSEKAKLVKLKDTMNLREKVLYMNRYSEMANTNIENLYDTILTVNKNLKEEEQIKKLVIISDMQFDPSEHNYKKSTYEVMKERFSEAGLEIPQIVFWNVGINRINYPTTDSEGVMFISGFSNYAMSMIMKNEKFNPVEIMNQILEPFKELMRDYNIY